MDERVLMQKLLNIMILGLAFYNTVKAESSLSKCKGDDDTHG